MPYSWLSVRMLAQGRRLLAGPRLPSRGRTVLCVFEQREALRAETVLIGIRTVNSPRSTPNRPTVNTLYLQQDEVKLQELQKSNAFNQLVPLPVCFASLFGFEVESTCLLVH